MSLLEPKLVTIARKQDLKCCQVLQFYLGIFSPCFQFKLLKIRLSNWPVNMYIPTFMGCISFLACFLESCLSKSNHFFSSLYIFILPICRQRLYFSRQVEALLQQPLPTYRYLILLSLLKFSTIKNSGRNITCDSRYSGFLLRITQKTAIIRFDKFLHSVCYKPGMPYTKEAQSSNLPVKNGKE